MMKLAQLTEFNTNSVQIFHFQVGSMNQGLVGDQLYLLKLLILKKTMMNPHMVQNNFKMPSLYSFENNIDQPNEVDAEKKDIVLVRID